MTIVKNRKECALERILMPWVFDVIEQANLAGMINIKDKALDIRTALYGLNPKIETLFNVSIYSPHLRASREQANSLYEAIARIYEVDDYEQKIAESDIVNIQLNAKHFKIVLLADLTTMPLFLVRPKGNYDVLLLIEHGIGCFPERLSSKAPEAMSDAMEAGKALAFELATACAFHTFRVVETVLKRYWDLVSEKTKRPKLETIGNYVLEMEKKKIGDKKVLETLKQLGKLYRNPIIHPEVFLLLEEAIEILGISRSVISAMLKQLPELSQKTISE